MILGVCEVPLIFPFISSDLNTNRTTKEIAPKAFLLSGSGWCYYLQCDRLGSAGVMLSSCGLLIFCLANLYN